VSEKRSDALERLIRSIDLPGSVTFKAMFGGAAAYIDGTIFASLSEVGLGLKLAPDDQAELLARPGAKRLQYHADAPVSRHYVVIPRDMESEQDALRGWILRSHAHVRGARSPARKRARKSK
jgi:TfoX/Sxy family transcriptional regulator of competence genes